KVPLTLAILKGLLVYADGKTYALPVSSVTEIIHATANDIHMVDGREVIWLREHVLPLLDVVPAASDVVPAAVGRKSGAQRRNRGSFYAVVVQVNGARYALAVDELGGEEELVIKGIHDGLVTTVLVIGASILVKGRVALLLNLLAVVGRTAPTTTAPMLPPAPTHEPRAGGLA